MRFAEDLDKKCTLINQQLVSAYQLHDKEHQTNYKDEFDMLKTVMQENEKLYEKKLAMQEEKIKELTVLANKPAQVVYRDKP